MEKIKGVICPMLTPLDENQNIDEEGTRRLVRRLAEKKIDGLFILGTMGEFPMIVEEEKVRLIQIVLDEAYGKLPVMVNVSEQGPRKTERLLRKALDAGAEAVVLTPPHYYNTRNKQELSNYFSYFARNTDVPLIIYDAVYTNNLIPTDVLLELSYEKNIVGVKCSVFKHTQLLRERIGRNDFSILHGDETTLDYGLLAGADGIVPGICSLAADKCLEIYQLVTTGNLTEAMPIQTDLLQIQRTVYGSGKHWGNGHKYALSLLNVCQDHIATTLLPLSEDHKREIADIVHRYNIS